MLSLFKRRFSWLFTLAIAALVVVPFAAFADDVYNNIDGSIDATLESTSLTVGGSNGTTTLYIQPANGDGKNGCNLTSSTILQIAASSSNTGAATVSMDKDTFSSCGDTIIVTIAPVGAGSATISFSQVSNTTGGTYNFAPASFTVNVTAGCTNPNTPTITANPDIPNGLSGWYTSIPTVSASSTTSGATISYATAVNGGAKSAFSTTAPTLGQGTTIVYAKASNSTCSSGETSREFKVDTVAPTASATPDRAADHNGWYTSNLTVSYSGSDATPGSGNVTCEADESYTGPDSSSTSVAGTCTDAAGNSADATFSFKYDASAPSANLSASGTTGANGWYIDDVTISTSGSDDVSGPVTCTADQHQTAETAGATFNGSCTNEAGLTTDATALTIKLDKTGPSASLSASGTLGNNGWYVSDVTITTSGTESISSPVTCTAAQHQTTDTTGTTFNGSCTNDAGITTGATALTIKRDATAPTASATPDRAADQNGWYNHALSVSFSGTDATSGGVTCDTDKSYSSPDNNSASVAGTCTDAAGNSADATFSFKYDATAPTISAAISPAAPASTGWYNISTGSPKVSFTCGDNLSGVAGSCPSDYTFGDGADQSYSQSISDQAGNTASAGVSNIDVDTAAPALNISGATSSSTSVCSGIPSRPSFSPTDATSGIASSSDSWSTPSSSSGVGAYAYSATATDNAGNTASDGRSYTLNYGGAFIGFLQPINMDGSSRFKLGSTIPVKFQLMCGTTPISVGVAKMYVAKGDNVPDPGVDEAISTAAATTGNLFRYDTTGSQYIFNLSTKLGYTNPASSTATAFSAGSWTLKALLDDNSWRSVNIQIVK